MPSIESLDRALDELRRALGKEDAHSTATSIDALLCLTVQIIRFGDGCEIAKTMSAVQDMRNDAVGYNRMVMADRLTMVSRLLAAAASLRPPLPDGLTASDKLILAFLIEGNLSGRGLASKTGLTVETIARRLPKLRAAGMVDSWKEGRQTINQCTETGKYAASL